MKRRKIEETERDGERKREERVKMCVRRARVLREPLIGGFMAREFTGRDAMDTGLRAWTGGLKVKGGVKLWEGETMVSGMWVGGGDDSEGLGVVYGGE